MRHGRRWLLRWGVAALSLLVWAGTAFAQQCACCGEKITSDFFWLSSPALADRLPICRPCTKLETVCWTCRMPVKRDYLKLDDGRLLCALHAREAVLTQQDAETVFTEAKREMIRLLRGCGATPDRNITLQLVDLPQITKLATEVPAAQSTLATVGYTRSRRAGTDFTHVISILGGLGRVRFLATGAHEYAHAWMAENVAPDRRLDQNTIEGFCELASYRIMSDRNEELEKRYILTNAYTRGQIEAFVKAEDNHRFYRIVEWIKSGVEDRIEPENTARVLALKPEPAALPLWPQAVPTQVPDTLVLKGISGRPGRWLVLVNDLTLGEGEIGKARVGTSKVAVRCVSVSETAAVIELVDSGQRQELHLRP